MVIKKEIIDESTIIVLSKISPRSTKFKPSSHSSLTNKWSNKHEMVMELSLPSVVYIYKLMKKKHFLGVIPYWSTVKTLRDSLVPGVALLKYNKNIATLKDSL